jgi:hypothetical protein
MSNATAVPINYDQENRNLTEFSRDYQQLLGEAQNLQSQSPTPSSPEGQRLGRIRDMQQLFQNVSEQLRNTISQGRGQQGQSSTQQASTRTSGSGNSGS